MCSGLIWKVEGDKEGLRFRGKVAVLNGLTALICFKHGEVPWKKHSPSPLKILISVRQP